MKHRFAWDPTDSSDSFFDAAGAQFNWNFSPPASHVGSPPASASVEIPSAPALTSEAAESSAAQSGPTSTISMTAGGITINLLFDAAAMAAPASFRAGIQQAASLLTASISDRITVNIKIDYSGTGGGAAAGPDNGLYESYSSVRADLVNNATPGDATFNALPTGSSIQGQSSVAVWNAQLKLWGVLGANDTSTDDGSATFATDISSGLLVGVALHELTHAMGRVPYGTPYSASPDIFDFYRFSSSGVRVFNGASTASPAYFSLDGGVTKLADFGQISDPSDFLNSGVQGPNDPFNEFYSGSTLQSLTTVDKQQLDALGFHTFTPVTTVIESLGSTALVQSGAYYYLDSISTGSGPQLKFGGAPVVAGQFAPYTPVGVEQTAGGYEVALQIAGTQQFSIWNTDASGNYLSYAVYSGTSTALEALETSFHQDLNGDGVIGIPSTVIEALGSTSLVEIGSNYFLNNISTGTGPELKYGGAPVTAGQFAPYTPVAVEQTAGGYEVALQIAGTEQFSIWNTDSSGNFLSYTVYSGTSAALEALETSFHQDLNGDGVIGIPAATAVVIEAFGSTSLAEVGNNYFLDNVSTGTGPELQFGGAPVVAGQFAPYTPVAVEQTAGGYEVALQIAGTEQFSIWNTDSSGNYLSYAVYSGTSAALEMLETSFHQDLNGDGVIGAPSTVIEALGSTSLVEIGSNYFLDNISTGSGPELKFGGAPVAAGQFAPYDPVGVEQTAGGYEVALQIVGTQQFSIWNTDSSGNFLSYSVYSGTSTALEALETSFHQDLNGDGVIGIPSTVIEALGSTSLVEIGNNYFLNNISTGSGPELKFGGVPVAAGQFAPYDPVGVEQTAGGYEVALQIVGTEQFSIWNTDSSGNYLSYAVYSGTSTALEALETSFHQDLNGDGVIGIPTTVIEALGSTSLVEIGSNYFLDNISTGTGPELKYGGAPVAAGQFAPYDPVGVEQTAGGYEVALQIVGTQQFSIWNTDSSGNFLSFSVYSGTSAALEALETSFHQDLNHDGVIGIPAGQAPNVTSSAAVPYSAPVADNHSFAFRPDLGAGSNTQASDTFVPGESPWGTGHHVMAMVPPANDSHFVPGDLANHHDVTWTNAHLADLHTHDFLIR